ncbi:MAG: hypothetical protein RL129_809 [Actinomycetota bacterium]|jgi:hypothetical protein
MTENNKPEWFEIAESDGVSQPAKVRRTLPIAAVVAAALIIGVGAVVAQTQEETPAQAIETTTAATDQVNPTTSVSATATPNTTVTPTQSAMANPNIAKLPTGGEHEGEEGEHEGRGKHGPREPHDENEEHNFEGDND